MALYRYTVKIRFNKGFSKRAVQQDIYAVDEDEFMRKFNEYVANELAKGWKLLDNEITSVKQA